MTVLLPSPPTQIRANRKIKPKFVCQTVRFGRHEVTRTLIRPDEAIRKELNSDRMISFQFPGFIRGCRRPSARGRC